MDNARIGYTITYDNLVICYKFQFNLNLIGFLYFYDRVRYRAGMLIRGTGDGKK